MLDYRFRVTKYDPRLRNESGAFIGDDWTCISEIGQVFDGQVLTRERYEQVEAAYLKAVELFAQESGITELAVRTPLFGRDFAPGPLLPGYGPTTSGLLSEEFYDGRQVSLPEGLELVRAMLREDGVWCRLEAEGRFSAEVGWDYYLYVNSHQPCSQAVDEGHRLGLFVEEDFTSPYDLDLEDPTPYRSADERFWAEVELLATQTGGELPLLEMWAYNTWRWHLVTPGTGIAQVRATLKPRALVTAFIGAPLEVSDSGMAEIADHIRLLLDMDSSVVGVMCLIEDRDTGRLRHDYLLDDDDLSAWLDAARKADRCGVYPVDAVDQLGALVAVLPDEDGIVRARWE
ncbi:hypothetical protein [Streptosporangium sp. NBC_01756]|uniref:hypothetical protein n=1 Tax=Streptosporangium sp. NBC_01756 TaxID=2975950 RepID=UPI002DDAA81F|nr:hypothetical protein [Streptosporangium sp. NBC_01756]WSC90429.1 hypothetical protein OIE48_20325 [Streptosporangium sp. NBC_01756]